MIGEKRNFSFISPIVKLIICRVHDQYEEKKIVWFQKFSIPSPLPQKGFLLRPPPPPLWKFWSSFIYLKFWAFENQPTTPHPHKEFPVLSLWGEYGYCLELHNIKFSTMLSLTKCPSILSY